MATDWNNPQLTQTWADRDQAIKGRDESLAKMDFSGDTNIPVGTIRWNDSTKKFEKWDGSTWQELTAKYIIDVDKLDGQHGSYYEDIAARLGYTPVNKAGDMMSGILQVPSLKAKVSIPSSDPPSSWPYGFCVGEVYNNGYPVNYGIVFSYRGAHSNECVQILQAWPNVDQGESYLYIRAKRDIGNDAFGPWRKVWSENNDGAGSGLDADTLDGVDAANFNSIVSTSETKTIGSGGDFATLTEALTYYAKKYPAFANGGTTVTLKILSGTTISEQIFISDIDFSWIKITSDDTTVTISRAAMTQSVEDVYGGQAPSVYPFISVRRGKAPIIATNLAFDSSGSLGSTCILHAMEGGYIKVENNKTLTGGYYGIVAEDDATIDVSYCTLTGQTTCASIARGAKANLIQSTFSYTNYAIIVNAGAIVQANGTTGTVNIDTNTVTDQGIIFR